LRFFLLLALVLGLASAAGAYLVSNTRTGGTFVYERLPSSRLPVDLLVDTEPVPGVTDPLTVTQDLMNQWNAVSEAGDPFGTAISGGPYNGSTVGSTFGVFTNSTYEVAWDDTGEILQFFGLGTSVLGITLKSVDSGRGNILDFLVVINTQPGFLVAPGTGATAEDLFRSTLLHELGHATGLGHSPVGIANQTTFGLVLAAPSQMPSMYPFRLPVAPQEGTTINGDDIAGLTSIYPEDVSGLGSISGTVRAASGAPVNEIAVRAVGPAGVGEQHIGILSDGDGAGQGRFTIPNLPPGSYRVVIETVNGRGSVTSFNLAGSTDALGGAAFLFAQDELWQPGDTWDPGADDPQDFAFVAVRAGRDTGGVDFVLNGTPLSGPVAGSLGTGDARLGDAGGGFHWADYYVFAGVAGNAVTLTVNASGFVPQLQLLGATDLAILAEDLPLGSNQATVQRTLPVTGVYTVVLSARATTGNPGGSGTYSLNLQGASGTLPAAPVVSGATLQRGVMDPGTQAFASPVCSLPVLQLLLQAPSHEELWVDGVTVRGSGTGSETLDVQAVSIVADLDGDGQRDKGEPVLGTGTFTVDNGSVTINGLKVQVPTGETRNLLVVYDVAVTSVSATAGFTAWWLLPLLLPLLALRRRAAVLLLVLALLPLSCGGGGGGSGCNGPFDPAGAVVTFQATVQAGGLAATTSTGNPPAPLSLPTAPIASGTLSVSN